MIDMLEQILQYLRNYFVTEIHLGSFTVENGGIELDFLQNGQYFRIVGSIFNDGVYQYGEELDLTDETFDGAVWAMAVPKAVLTLAEDIQKWEEQYGDIVAGPYTSESFGGYSYTKSSSNSSTNSDDDDGWQKAFKSRLAPYRKAREVAPVCPTYQGPTYQKPFNPNNPYSR